MSLLDQFRRPDRTISPPVKKEPETGPVQVHAPASSDSKVAEQTLPNRASEEDAA